MRSLVKSAPALRLPDHGQAGIAIVEVVISAVLIIIVAGGAIAALQSSDKAVAEERHRAQAHGVGQEDQARMRSMRISDLANLNDSRVVTIEGMRYTVESRGDFVSDATGTASCTQGTASADYIQITSEVTWPTIGTRPPVLVQSTVAPPNGSISEDHGALAVSVQNGQGQGISGVGLVGTGAGSFSGTTGANGCAIFGNLPEGNYTLTPSVSTGLVDHNGNPPAPLPTSVVGLSTNTVVFQYDSPGSIDVTFTTRVGGILVPSSADAITVFNTGMTAAETFGTPGTRTATITSSQLFPFASPDTVYAGACTTNNPDPDDDDTPPAAASLASVIVPPGATTTASVQLPALHVTVWNGTSATTPGTRVANARVTVIDDFCSLAGVPLKRVFTTNANGQIADPGLPWSQYDVCADNGVRRSRVLTTGTTKNQNMVVQSLTAGTAVPIYLTGTTNSQAGTCP